MSKGLLLGRRLETDNFIFHLYLAIVGSACNQFYVYFFF